MAEWSKNRANPSDINGNREFTTNDNLSVKELNAIVNNSFYGVDFAEAMADSPDISEIAGEGSPSVSLVANGKFKKFKFSNLKGSKGDKGERGEKGEKGAAGESNALIKYIGQLAIEQMLVKDLVSLIESSFGTHCKQYYITPAGGINNYNITISSAPDGVTGGSLGASLMNKYSGEVVKEINSNKFVTGKSVGVGGSSGIFKTPPMISSDYVEISKCPAYLTSPTWHNIRFAWAFYELNILDTVGSVYIKSPDSSIRIYGLTF